MDSILSVNVAWFIVFPIIIFFSIVACCCCKMREKTRALNRERVRRAINNVTNGQSDVFVIDIPLELPPYSPGLLPPAYSVFDLPTYDPPSYEEALG